MDFIAELLGRFIGILISLALGVALVLPIHFILMLHVNPYIILSLALIYLVFIISLAITIWHRTVL